MEAWRQSGPSASEYTATVRTPSRRHVRITRHAISPRLAIRILSNGGEDEYDDEDDEDEDDEDEDEDDEDERVLLERRTRPAAERAPLRRRRAEATNMNIDRDRIYLREGKRKIRGRRESSNRGRGRDTHTTLLLSGVVVGRPLAGLWRFHQSLPSRPLPKAFI
mmetsp:Transcript_5983/g.17310  ORF Transcript_5983/g.17310 Transcript_5983/m.17310 type:complete len:164 (+) Transcript_5983:1925-2416(+)